MSVRDYIQKKRSEDVLYNAATEKVSSDDSGSGSGSVRDYIENLKNKKIKLKKH